MGYAVVADLPGRCVGLGDVVSSSNALTAAQCVSNLPGVGAARVVDVPSGRDVACYVAGVLTGPSRAVLRETVPRALVRRPGYLPRHAR